MQKSLNNKEFMNRSKSYCTLVAKSRFRYVLQSKRVLYHDILMIVLIVADFEILWLPHSLFIGLYFRESCVEARLP